LTPQLLILILITFLTSYVASAGEQWAAIYVSDTLRAGAALGATTYTIWVLSSAAGLLVVDRIAQRLGLLRLFRLSIPLSAAGLGVGFVINTPIAAIAGFAVLGLCTACVGPVINTLAGRQPRLTATEGVSVVQLGEPPGFLISPLLIGSVATAIGLRWALATTVVSLIAAAALAIGLRANPTRNSVSPSS
jgi:MFS family permease